MGVHSCGNRSNALRKKNIFGSTQTRLQTVLSDVPILWVHWYTTRFRAQGLLAGPKIHWWQYMATDQPWLFAVPDVQWFSAQLQQNWRGRATYDPGPTGARGHWCIVTTMKREMNHLTIREDYRCIPQTSLCLRHVYSNQTIGVYHYRCICLDS